MATSCASQLIGMDGKCQMERKSIQDYLCTSSCVLARQPIGSVSLLIGREGPNGQCLSTTELMSFVRDFAEVVRKSGYVLLAHTSNTILNHQTLSTGSEETGSNGTT